MTDAPAAATANPAGLPGGTPVTVTAQYIKDFSFESPNAPLIFAPVQSAPEITMGVNVHTRALTVAGMPADVSGSEVLLALKLEAKLEGKTGFIAELVYGGVFLLPPRRRSSSACSCWSKRRACCSPSPAASSPTPCARAASPM